MNKLTVTIEETAVALGIGRNSAYAAAHTGEIPAIKVGKRLLVPLAALEKMLSAPDTKAARRKKKGRLPSECLERRSGARMREQHRAKHV